MMPSASAKLPADLAQPCPKLPELADTTGAVVLPWAVAVVGMYNDCAQRHDAAVKSYPK